MDSELSSAADTAGGDAAVILPTYDEPATAPDVIRGLAEYCPDISVWVIDDSPSMETTDAVRTIDVPCRVSVYRPGRPADLSKSILDGFELADARRLVVMDADGQHPPEAVPALLEAVDVGADLAVASRHVGDSRMTADWTLGRTITSFGASCLAWLALPPARRHLQDPMSGFFAVERRVVTSALDELDPTGFKILLEVLARCPVRQIAELPVDFRPRQDGESNLSREEYLRFLRHIAELAVVYRRRPPIRNLSYTEADG